MFDLKSIKNGNVGEEENFTRGQFLKYLSVNVKK